MASNLCDKCPVLDVVDCKVLDIADRRGYEGMAACEVHDMAVKLIELATERARFGPKRHVS